MSIDKLITELDKEPRNLKVIQACAWQGLQDYIGVAEAYVSLLGTVLQHDAKVELISTILIEVMQNVQGLNKLKQFLNQKAPDLSEIDIYTGQVLRGEQTIDSLIARFESLDN